MYVRMHPSNEDLAAFIDGTLHGQARQTVTEHLADCPECYRVFAETLRFQMEPRRPSRWWRHPSTVRALAASLVAVAGLGFWLWLQPGPGGRRADVPRPPAAATVADLWTEPAIPGFTARPEDRQTAFRVGVALVDLEVARHAGDSAAIARLEAHVAGLVGKDAGSVEELAQGLDPAAVSFGRWAEVGRLAARTQDAASLQTAQFRAALERLPADSPALAAVRRGLAAEPKSRRDFDQLASAFADLIFLGGDFDGAR